MSLTTKDEIKKLEYIYSSITENASTPKPLGTATRVLSTQEDEEKEGIDVENAPRAIKVIRKKAKTLVVDQSDELDKAGQALKKAAFEHFDHEVVKHARNGSLPGYIKMLKEKLRQAERKLIG